MSDDDFLSAVGDVRRIEPAKRVTLKKDAITHGTLQARRSSAQKETTAELNELSGDDLAAPLEPHAILDFRRPGVQHGVYRNVRLGKYVIDARLDLHHHNVDQARAAVRAFVKDCLHNDIRYALITHGKGEGRKQPALLKSCVAHWLPQLDEVLAFHSAQKQHGGSGATYVLLRKSEKKRQDNLELHQRRGR